MRVFESSALREARRLLFPTRRTSSIPFLSPPTADAFVVRDGGFPFMAALVPLRPPPLPAFPRSATFLVFFLLPDDIEPFLPVFSGPPEEFTTSLLPTLPDSVADAFRQQGLVSVSGCPSFSFLVDRDGPFFLTKVCRRHESMFPLVRAVAPRFDLGVIKL